MSGDWLASVGAGGRQEVASEVSSVGRKSCLQGYGRGSNLRADGMVIDSGRAGESKQSNERRRHFSRGIGTFVLIFKVDFGLILASIR